VTPDRKRTIAANCRKTRFRLDYGHTVTRESWRRWQSCVPRQEAIVSCVILRAVGVTFLCHQCLMWTTRKTIQHADSDLMCFQQNECASDVCGCRLHKWSPEMSDSMCLYHTYTQIPCVFPEDGDTDENLCWSPHPNIRDWRSLAVLWCHRCAQTLGYTGNLAHLMQGKWCYVHFIHTTISCVFSSGETGLCCLRVVILCASRRVQELAFGESHEYTPNTRW